MINTNLIFTNLKLCLATATHSFKWVKIAHICLIWDETAFVKIHFIPNISDFIDLKINFEVYSRA